MGDSDRLLQNLADVLVQEMRAQIRAAGHVMTGALLESVESVILRGITGATISILLNSYGIALDQGVPPERIPYTPPSGRGGTSLYIQGLQRFAQLKLGVTDMRESLRVAFAIAAKHKKVGMPVTGPTEFIQATVNATEAEIQKFVEDFAELVFEVQLDSIIQNIRA
jgi:hypothetical protein